jgi:hypothetical protein
MKNARSFGALVAASLLLTPLAASAGPVGTEPEKPLYRDASRPMENRVEDLLSRMTLEEKIGQMNMPCVYEDGLGKTIPEKMEGVKRFAEGTWIKGFGPGGGFFTLPNNILVEGPRQQAEFLNGLQKIAMEKTRLGIPLLLTEEGTHGLMCSGGTIFPEGPALGSIWDTELISRVYTAVATRSSRSSSSPTGTRGSGATRRPTAKTPTCAPATPRRSSGRPRAKTFRPPTRWWPGSATTRAKASRRAGWSGGPWRSPSAC